MKLFLKIACGQMVAMLLLWAYVACAGEKYREFLESQCRWCHKSNVRLVIHHKKLQNDHPELMNVKENCVTLCDPFILRSTGCHWKIGHRGINWKYDNSAWTEILFEK